MENRTKDSIKELIEKIKIVRDDEKLRETRARANMKKLHSRFSFEDHKEMVK